jgi:hypothetical protein
MTMTTKQKTTEQRHKNTPLEGTDLSAAETMDARHEGAVEAEKESAKQAVSLSTGTETNETQPDPHLGSDEIMMWSHIPELGLEAFTAAIAEDAEHPIPENKIAGIYKLERNGKNRTPYVQALRKRLGLKKGEDVPGAGGPDYTNDVSAVSAL